MIRDRQLLISGWLLAQLRIYADLKGLVCAEDAAELIIRERLAQTPELEDLAKRRADHKKQADKEWREAHATFKLE